MKSSGVPRLQASRLHPIPCVFAILLALTGLLHSPFPASAAEGYLSRVGPPPLRLSVPDATRRVPVAPRTTLEPSVAAIRATNVNAASSSEAGPASGRATPPSPADAAKAEDRGMGTHDPIGPPLPPDWDKSGPPFQPPSVAAHNGNEPPGSSPSQAPIRPPESPGSGAIEHRVSSPSIGIRSFEPPGRVGITAQMLVRFFQKDPDTALASGPDALHPETNPEVWIPVEFIPPQPAPAAPSSSATYQLVPKP